MEPEKVSTIGEIAHVNAPNQSESRVWPTEFEFSLTLFRNESTSMKPAALPQKSQVDSNTPERVSSHTNSHKPDTIPTARLEDVEASAMPPSPITPVLEVPENEVAASRNLDPLDIVIPAEKITPMNLEPSWERERRTTDAASNQARIVPFRTTPPDSPKIKSSRTAAEILWSVPWVELTEQEQQGLSRLAYEFLHVEHKVEFSTAAIVGRVFPRWQLENYVAAAEPYGVSVHQIADLLAVSPAIMSDLQLNGVRYEIEHPECLNGNRISLDDPEPEEPIPEESSGEQDESPEADLALLEAEIAGEIAPGVTSTEDIYEPLLRRHKLGDQRARDEIVSCILPYVEIIATKLHTRLPSNSIDLEDLISEGVIGVLGAVERFNFDFKVRFTTYVQLPVLGAMVDYLRCVSPVSRATTHRYKKLNDLADDYFKSHGHTPTGEELLENTHLSPLELFKLQEASSRLRSSRSVSLNAPISGGSYSDSSGMDHLAIGECISDRSGVEASRHFLKIGALLQNLMNRSELERVVMTLMIAEASLKRIGSILDLSESRVSQIVTALRDDFACFELGRTNGTPSTAESTEPKQSAVTTYPVIADKFGFTFTELDAKKPDQSTGEADSDLSFPSSTKQSGDDLGFEFT